MKYAAHLLMSHSVLHTACNLRRGGSYSNVLVLCVIKQTDKDRPAGLILCCLKLAIPAEEDATAMLSDFDSYPTTPQEFFAALKKGKIRVPAALHHRYVLDHPSWVSRMEASEGFSLLANYIGVVLTAQRPKPGKPTFSDPCYAAFLLQIAICASYSQYSHLAGPINLIQLTVFIDQSLCEVPSISHQQNWCLKVFL